MIYFGCWNEDSTPADFIAKITFEDCWATKSIHSEYLEYKVEEYKHRSYILKVENSVWLSELNNKKKELYPNSHTDHLNYCHYVINGHDVYVEVIAKDFVLKRISREQAGHYAWLIDEA
ncbi:hypothetical protein J31TS4_23010 [Paenibacillus sp. J31TS4]|uniref:hypothetical protein n=1 Tax=Paenibacillus sp. J31TS4 TaxID=2807195 RepID=UPI001B06ED10|nr:hypothetical protein [Paenibacillus sp. J31TS4]GIP39021.1 hypothetical protein J31TS4_23010 [Paenibacillus sp. J31TS4]